MSQPNDFPSAPRYDDSTIAHASTSGGKPDGIATIANGAPEGKSIITVQPIRKQEMQTSYAVDLGLDNVEHGFYGSMMNCLGEVAGFFGQIPCCFCCPNPFQYVNQGSVGLVTRFGRLYKSVDPGLVKVNVFSESLRTVDVKITLISIPRQVVLTADNLSIEVDSSLCYHISNPLRATFSVANVHQALSERAQTTLRDVIGSRSLQSILTDREAVAQQIATLVEKVSESWGVTVESLLLKDISLSHELQQSLGAAATQRRHAEAKLILAKAEVEAAKLMREAADQLSTDAAIQIRQLDALQQMAKQADTKVIFVPMSLAHHFPSGGSAANPSFGDGDGGKGKAVAKPMMDYQESTTLGQLAQ
ncbi:hypothetical protein V8E36_005467 [Tilletia maclaganii]